MNTNRITNKNLKRIAIAAGTTAAALFLSAGLVACDSKSSDTVAVPAQAAELTEVLENVVAEIAPAVEETLAVEAEVAPVVETATKSVSKPAVKSTKASKKKASAVGGTVVLDTPTVSESAPAVDTTVAPVAQPAAQQADNTVVNAPAEQPTVEQPAAQQQAAATASAPASSGSTTGVSIPKITGTPNLVSKVGGIDLTKVVTPITVLPNCLPGFTC